MGIFLRRGFIAFIKPSKTKKRKEKKKSDLANLNKTMKLRVVK